MENHEIIKIDGEQLSPQQIAFNKKILKVKTLRLELERLTDIIPKAKAQYALFVDPLADINHQYQKQHILEIGNYFEEIKLSKKERALYEKFISHQILELYENTDETDILLAQLFEKINERSIQEHIDAEEDLLKEMLEQQFGVNIDRDKSIEEQEHEIFEKIIEKEQHSEQYKTAKKPRKKTKAEIKREEKERLEAALAQKSIREIYIDLIKIFHPDTEQDQEQKLIKEEISKKITEAYSKNDLFSLIKIETDYLEQNTNRLNKLKADRLKIYQNILTKQIHQLEHELYRIKSDAEEVYRNMCYKNSKPEKYLKSIAEEFNNHNQYLINEIKSLQSRDKKLKSMLFDYMDHSMEQIEHEAMLMALMGDGEFDDFDF